jgi:hypothetical protein
MRWITAGLLLLVSWNVWGQSTSAGTISSYPLIVARVALTNQTAPIPPTTIVTPKQARLYRVSYYLDCGGQNLDWMILLHWVDTNGTSETFTSAPCNSPSNPSLGVATVRASASSPLRYETTGVAGHHDLFFTVERLN